MGLSLDSLTIKPANAAQTRRSREASFEEWNRGLTLEQYIDREFRLEQYDFAAGGKLITWVLVPRNDLDTEDILCACETYRRRIAVLEPEKSEPIFAIGYGIASVYTREHLRSNGYASHMMRLLHRVLAIEGSLPPFPREWGSPPPVPAGAGDGLVSVLYSDVGQFYASHGPTLETTGWSVSGPGTTVWKVAGDGIKSIDLGDRIQWMDEATVREELQTDEVAFLSDFAQSIASDTRFTFLPAENRVLFTIIRVTLTMNPPPVIWGAKRKNTKEFVVWTYELEPSPSRIIILHTRVKSGESLRILVEAALKTAYEEGIEQVEAWNLPDEFHLTAEEMGGKNFEREDHLPSFRWYGKPDNAKNIIWRNNEKFPWC